MPIHFTCAICAKMLTVADAAAGTPAKCPNCGELLRVPAPPVTHSSASATRPVPRPPPPPAARPVGDMTRSIQVVHHRKNSDVRAVFIVLAVVGIALCIGAFALTRWMEQGVARQEDEANQRMERLYEAERQAKQMAHWSQAEWDIYHAEKIRQLAREAK